MARRRIRAMTMIAAAAPLAAALVALPAAPAQAAQGDLTCSATFNLTLDPPLRAGAAASVAISGNLDNCTSPNGRYTSIRSGTLTGTGSATATAGGFNPCRLLVSANGNGTIDWSAGSDSTFAWRITPDPITGMSFSANVTGGQLNGDTITVVPRSAQPNQGCATNGLSTLAVTAQVAFN
ncbi:hypothetical protein [Nocardia iowensis]|uniref:Protein activator n=1 Tax=Nocardia iowensis TaxID=204891 RepID=A0ABX8RWH9_NOCIO|nr:hypothetical protein [Nocardia iowensis]QXN93327.1 hypothetical protein KV110_09680 [Nocardia iowensis]